MGEDEIIKQLNKSGFPLQLAIEHQIRATEQEHGWSIASREHPWTNPHTNSSGFIDMLLCHKDYTTFRLAIECKRIRADDRRQLRWLFLAPDRQGENEKTYQASCFEVEGWGEQYGAPKAWTDVRFWDDVHLTPPSFQSEFCILPSDEQKRTPILESLSSELLESVEGLAQEEVNIQKSKNGFRSSRLFIFPAVVTNADIVLCRFKSASVQLSDGTIDHADVGLESVPFVRFRKSLATRFPEGEMSDLRSANRARERSVFIVNSSHMKTFLLNWDLHPLGGHEYATQRYLRIASMKDQ